MTGADRWLSYSFVYVTKHVQQAAYTPTDVDSYSAGSTGPHLRKVYERVLFRAFPQLSMQ